jgi:hypothetical protein
MKLTKVPHLVLAGILGLGLALSTAGPASARPNGRLRDERRDVNQAKRQFRRADNRFERRAARANVQRAKRNLREERRDINRDNRWRRNSNLRLRNQRRDAARRNSPIPRTVYNSRFNY